VITGTLHNTGSSTVTLDDNADLSTTAGLTGGGATPLHYSLYIYNATNQSMAPNSVTLTYMSASCPYAPTATPSLTATTTATPPPTTTPTSTATTTPPPTATATPAIIPSTVSGAPDGLCPGTAPTPLLIKIQPEIEPSGVSGTPVPGDAKYQPEEYYCPSVYAIGSHLALYANGIGLGNNYGHDANFKGFDGNSSLWNGLLRNSNSQTGFQKRFNEEVDRPQNTGGGSNGPTAPCPAIVRVPLISRIAHHGNFDWFAPLGLI